jgi:hypothetical protein
MLEYFTGIILGAIFILIDTSGASKSFSSKSGKGSGAGTGAGAGGSSSTNCGCSGRNQPAPTVGYDPAPLSPPLVVGAPTEPKTTTLNPELLHVDPLSGLFAGAGQSSALGNLNTPPGYAIDPLTGLLVPQAYH